MQTDLLPNESLRVLGFNCSYIKAVSPWKLLKILERSNLKAQQNNRRKDWTKPFFLLLGARCKAMAWVQGDLPRQPLPASGNLKLEDSWAMRNNHFFVSNSSQKAFYPWLSVPVLWAHSGVQQAEQPGVQGHGTPIRGAGENILPLVCSELAAWLFHLKSPDLLAGISVKIHSFLPSFFATSEMPPLAPPPCVTSTLCHLSTSRSPRPFNLPPHKSHPHTWASLSPCCSSPIAINFWSSNGCIFICISYVFGVSASWQKGDTDDSASHGAHTDVCICSHATEGECALQVHLPLMYVLSAVGLFSSELKWFSI